jgi:hypothetical protein
MLRKIFRLFFQKRPPPPPPRPPDPRLADPWLGRLFAVLPDRYQLGPDAPSGAQILRRTGRARFNPMRVWLNPAQRLLRAEYEVRGEAAAARTHLDEKVGQRASSLQLSQVAESVSDWGGNVLTRVYEGRLEAPEQAAAAIRFVCEESEQQVNLAAE